MRKEGNRMNAERRAVVVAKRKRERERFPERHPLQAALQAARERVKHPSAVLLAGSAARGPVPPGGDLDLVVFTDDKKERSRRMLVRNQGILAELFVIAEDDYPALLREARKTGLPSLVRMCKDSRIVLGGERAAGFVREAQRIWMAGPLPVTYAELDRRRMELAELADDFHHAVRPEALFVAGKLLEKTAEFLLRAEDRWLGVGKWAHRTLEEFEPQAARDLVEAADAFFRHDRRQPLVRFIEGKLAPYGGFLREGWMEEARLPAGTGKAESEEGTDAGRQPE